jgi:dephospho-CoA kinase
MHILGLLGGVASGKSTVAEQMTRLGAGVLDADRAGHEVLRLADVEDAARERWGDAVFGADGHIDRRRLAEVVFASPPKGPEERRFLEELTHPRIARLLEGQAERLAATGCRVAVMDAPLLLEAGWDRLCHRLILVDAPRALRLARALARGWTEKEFAEREGVQESLDFKRKRADAVVDNSGSPAQTQAQIEQLWPSLAG